MLFRSQSNDVHYHGKAWLIQSYPWIAWQYDLGAVSGPGANHLVAEANARLSGLRLYVNESGHLLLESPSIGASASYLDAFTQFVSQAEALIPTLSAFVAGGADVTTTLGALP